MAGLKDCSLLLAVCVRHVEEHSWRNITVHVCLFSILGYWWSTINNLSFHSVVSVLCKLEKSSEYNSRLVIVETGVPFVLIKCIFSSYQLLKSFVTVEGWGLKMMWWWRPMVARTWPSVHAKSGKWRLSWLELSGHFQWTIFSKPSKRGSFHDPELCSFSNVYPCH